MRVVVVVVVVVVEEVVVGTPNGSMTALNTDGDLEEWNPVTRFCGAAIGCVNLAENGLLDDLDPNAWTNRSPLLYVPGVCDSLLRTTPIIEGGSTCPNRH